MGRVRSIPRTRLPRRRRVAADRALLRRWLLAGALAATTVVLTGRVLGEATAARDRWGPTRPVLVTTADRAVGDPLGPTVATRRWPTSLVPDGALSVLPVGARAAVPLAAGSPLTEPALDGAGPGGDHRRRVALPRGSSRLPVRPGDRVEVWATTDPSLTGGSGPSTRAVADEATVVVVADDTVVVAVERHRVSAVAEAAALATVTLVAVG